MSAPQPGLEKWTIRRAALLGAAFFFGGVIWRGMTLTTPTAERAVDGAIWAMVAVLAVYALGVSAEQLIVLIKTIRDGKS